MKIPEIPPQLDEIIPKLIASNFEKAMHLIGDFEPVDRKGRYLPWEKLKHLDPPEGLTPEMWWAGIKFARTKLYRQLPLLDRKQKPFVIAMPDSVLKQLHWLDRNMAGSIVTAFPAMNPDMKETYLVRSFVEEAINSSQLEGAATTRKVAKEMIRQGRDPIDKSEQMIFNNYYAMQFIKDIEGEPLSPSHVLELHRILTEKTLDNPKDSGKYRTKNDDVFVVDGQGGILYTPPGADELPDRMRALCDFANQAETEIFIHPIVRAILLHFMLAYDHPFVDGNGRTARALFYWSVARQGYWVMEFLSISRILQGAPAQYGRAFLYTETDVNDTTYFVIHQLDIIRDAINQLEAFIRKKQDDIKKAEKLLKGSQRLRNRLNHRQMALLRHALKHPGHSYTIVEHQNTHGIVYQTARSDLLTMADELELLIKQKFRRSFIFLAPDNLKEQILNAKFE